MVDAGLAVGGRDDQHAVSGAQLTGGCGGDGSCVADHGRDQVARANPSSATDRPRAAEVAVTVASPATKLKPLVASCAPRPGSRSPRALSATARIGSPSWAIASLAPVTTWRSPSSSATVPPSHAAEVARSSTACGAPFTWATTPPGVRCSVVMRLGSGSKGKTPMRGVRTDSASRSRPAFVPATTVAPSVVSPRTRQASGPEGARMRASAYSAPARSTPRIGPGSSTWPTGS